MRTAERIAELPVNVDATPSTGAGTRGRHRRPSLSIRTEISVRTRIVLGLVGLVAVFIWFRATDDTAAAAGFHDRAQQVAVTPGASKDVTGAPLT